jgi:hypothetical protein
MINPTDIQPLYNFVNEPFFPVIIISIAIFGLLLQLYLNFFRAKSKKILFYYISPPLCRSASTENARFIFKERYAKKINFLYVYLWNSGWETIDNRDIAKNSKITLKNLCKNIKIENIEIFCVNNLSNDFKLAYNDETDTITIDFDYINPNDGVVIRIINTQTETPPLDNCFEISGIIKGFRSPIRTILSPLRIFPLFGDKKRIGALIIFLAFVIGIIWTFYTTIMSSEIVSISVLIAVTTSIIPQTYAYFIQWRLPIEFEMIETIESENLVVFKKNR